MPSQEQQDALFKSSDQRSNFKNVIAKRSDLVRTKRGRLVAPGSDGTVFEAGLVLGVVTASGLYAAYASGNSDGTQVAVGVLKDSVIADTSGSGTEIDVIFEGTLFKDLLIGYDGTAATAMAAKAFVEGGNNLVTIRA